jgi:predicted permease
MGGGFRIAVQNVSISPVRIAGEEVAVTVFNVSRRGLALIAVIAIALLILGIATSLGLFGWTVAILLGAYVIVMMVRGRRR